MKRCIFVIVCLLAFAATAQEKKGGFMADAGFALYTYGNYPALSAITDATERYASIVGERLSLGYYNAGNNYFIGLLLATNSGYTANIATNERFTNVYAMLDLRDYIDLGERFGIEFGVAAGFLAHNNVFDYGSDIKAVNRYGVAANIGLGVFYNIDPAFYIYLRGNMHTTGAYLNSSPTMPAGFDANLRDQLLGYSISVGVGMRL